MARLLLEDIYIYDVSRTQTVSTRYWAGGVVVDNIVFFPPKNGQRPFLHNVLFVLIIIFGACHSRTSDCSCLGELIYTNIRKETV